MKLYGRGRRSFHPGNGRLTIPTGGCRSSSDRRQAGIYVRATSARQMGGTSTPSCRHRCGFPNPTGGHDPPQGLRKLRHVGQRKRRLSSGRCCALSILPSISMRGAKPAGDESIEPAIACRASSRQRALFAHHCGHSCAGHTPGIAVSLAVRPSRWPRHRHDEMVELR